MIHVLINDVVKRYFLDQPRKVRAKIRDKFEYLENGIWDAGLKVKKLKGVSSKVVFEARLDKGNRILFSLGKDSIDSVDALLVYVWGIVVHDDISAKSRNILPAEVPFLRFKNYQEELYDGLDFGELPAAYFTQEKMSDQILEDSATQRWHQVDEPEWKRILRYARDDFELLLYLSPRQTKIMKTAPPLLISGTAGSGKTTMAVYYLLKKGLQKQSKLFLTYNPHLRDFSKKLYDGLLNEREDASSWHEPDFRTFKDLCLDIARKYHREFPPAKEMDYATFDDVFSVHPLYKKFDAALVWEEIRSIIKGGMTQVSPAVIQKAVAELKKGELKPDLIRKLQTQFLNFAKLESDARIEKFTTKYLQTDLMSFATHLDGHIAERPDRVRPILENTLESLSKHGKIAGQKHLSLFEYEMHGKKKAPNFRFNRKEIYQIFEWYENKLKAAGLWDELDLVRDVIHIISERDWSGHQYDLVVCDEIQDLTDMQQDLLFYLVKNPNNLLLAGDTKQIINPSGFRWEEIKRHFYERGLRVPELHFLTLNFRSSGSIVELSNKLLDLKQELLGVSSGESKEEWKYKGRPAVVVSDVSEATMIESVREAGARRTILVRTEQERDRLKKRLETELVFTIGEAKGLEFDTVLLWKFASDAQSKDVWGVIVEASTRNVHEAKIKHEINLLYVAITRARRELIIFDGDQPSSIWQNEQIADKTFVTSDSSYIDGIWNVISTPEEWREQGIYFFERKHYKAAMECFKNAGDHRRLAEASAYHFEKVRNYLKAARSFQAIEAWERAAENFERAGRFSEALELWSKLRRKDCVLRCRLEVLKKQGKHEEVARIYESARDYPRAREYYQKSRNHAKVAELCEKRLNKPEEAAHHYEKAEQHLQAAKLYHKLKFFDRAAPLYFKDGEYKKAESLWKKLGDKPNLIRLYEKTNQLEKLLEIYEKERDFRKSLKTLQPMKTANLLADADSYFSKRKYFPAWVRYYVAGDHRGIARSCYKLRNYDESAKYFALAGDSFAAGDAYYKAGDPVNALECFLVSEEDERENFKNIKKAARRTESLKLREIARRLFKAGDYTKAALLFGVSYNRVEQGLCYVQMGDRSKAIYVWKKTDSLEALDEISRECLREGVHDVVAELALHHYQFRRATPWYSPEWLLTETSYPHVFEAVERYLEESNNMEDMALWAEKLREANVEGKHNRRIMKYYEKAGRYNDCYLMGKYLGHKTEETVLREFEEEIPELERKGDLQGLALRYALSGRKDDLNRVLKNLEMTEENVNLFEESEQYMKAVDYYLDNDDIMSARLFFGRKSRIDELAPLLEHRGHLGEAARLYEYSGDRGDAIRCYEQLGDHTKVGDMYFRFREYPKALEAYLKEPLLDRKKLARTYERLADWENALRIYQEVGDAKGYERCKKKIDRIEAKQALPRLPFEQA